MDDSQVETKAAIAADPVRYAMATGLQAEIRRRHPSVSVEIFGPVYYGLTIAGDSNIIPTIHVTLYDQFIHIWSHRNASDEPVDRSICYEEPDSIDLVVDVVSKLLNGWSSRFHHAILN